MAQNIMEIKNPGGSNNFDHLVGFWFTLLIINQQHFSAAASADPPWLLMARWLFLRWNWKITIRAPIMVLLMVFHHYVECLIDSGQNKLKKENRQHFAWKLAALNTKIFIIPNTKTFVAHNMKTWLLATKAEEEGVRQEHDGMVCCQLWIGFDSCALDRFT